MAGTITSLTTVLIDDESHCTESLQWMLDQYCPNISVQGVFNDPVEGIAYLRSHKVDLIFLDIDMPGLNGFDLLVSLGEHSGRVIFTTAYDEFALKAIKHDALDYLLKPIDKDDLLKAVGKAHQNTSSTELQKLVRSLGGEERFAIPTKQGYEFLSMADISFAKADDNYTELHLTNGERRVVSRTLKSVQEELDGERFFRIHQSYLVALTSIAKYQRGNGGSVVMENGTEIPVSRSRKEELLAVLGVAR